MKPGALHEPIRPAIFALFVLASAAFLGCGPAVIDPPPGPDSITGMVADDSTGQPVGGATVALEQPDPTGVDRILATTTTASNGSFSFSGLQTGNYDIVADASITSPAGATRTYAATVTFRVPVGTALKRIPLVPEFGDSIPTGQPVQISATVTTSASNGAPVSADIKLSPLQGAFLEGATLVQVTVPPFAGSTPQITTSPSPSCSGSTSCSNYTLSVPSSEPVTGTFHSSGVDYSIPAPDPVEVIFIIEAKAFVRGSSTMPNCTPPTQTSGPVVPRGTLPSVIPNLAFVGCQ